MGGSACPVASPQHCVVIFFFVACAWFRALRVVWPRGGHYCRYVQEYLWTKLQPSQAHRVTLVLDLCGLTLSTIMNKEIVAIIKGCVQMTGTHYPQRSHKMLVLNVPGWFGVLFNIVKPLLNEAQRAKINIFRSHEVLAGMRETIPDENIPVEYGGSGVERLGQTEPEQALRRQVFANLTAAGLPLLVDGEMRNPGGARTADAGPGGGWKQWVYAPKPPNANFTPFA